MPNFTNPVAFQVEAATLLSAGYGAFPCTFNWTCDEDSDLYPTETGQSRAAIQSETIQWLREHGYLTGKGVVGGVWQHLQLTERALLALNSVPEALAGKEPLGKRLVAAVGKGSIELMKQLVPVAIKTIAGVAD
jgi:hypothetical protein